MTDEHIQDTVLAIVAKEARLDRASLTLDTNLSDLKIESLAMVQILFAIEEAFNVYIPQDDEHFRFATIRDVCAGVRALLAAS